MSEPKNDTRQTSAVDVHDPRADVPTLPVRVVSSPAIQAEIDQLELRARELDYFARLGDAMHRAGMLPKGMNAQGAALCMVKGKEVGFGTSTSLSMLAIINGRVGVMVEGALAILRRDGALKPGTDIEIEWVGKEGADDWGCRTRLWRKGQPKPFDSTFTVRDAKIAGKWKSSGPWSQYPNRMLQARALGFLLRDRFSDYLAGLWLDDELRDLPARHPERLVNPTPQERDPFLDEIERVEAEIAPRAPEDAPQATRPRPDRSVAEVVLEPEVLNGDSEEPGSYDVGVVCPKCAARDEYPKGMSLTCSNGCGVIITVDERGLWSWREESEAMDEAFHAEPTLDADAIRDDALAGRGMFHEGDPADVVAVGPDAERLLKNYAEPVQPSLEDAIARQIQEPAPEGDGPSLDDLPVAENPSGGPATIATCSVCNRPAEYGYGTTAPCPYAGCGAFLKISDEGEVARCWVPGSESQQGARPTLRMMCKCGKPALYDAEWGGRCPTDGCGREMRPHGDGFACHSKPISGRPPLPMAKPA